MMNIRLALVTSVALFCAAPLVAQNANIEGRVKKLEKEVGAIQNKVFPKTADGFFEPEIKADPTKPAGSTASSTVTDLLSRVDTLESQMTSLTGQIEQQQKETRDINTRLSALEAQLKPEPAAVTPAPVVTVKPTPTPVATKPPATTAAKPEAARVAAVTALQKPATNDAFEDAYGYGFRLWEAKYYPEAQAQLTTVTEKYPKHIRASFARNLLGRSYLDDGKPAQAVKILYDNYKNDPKGERAPESLYYLGWALTDLGKPAEACDAYNQLVKAYPSESASRLGDRLREGRTRAKCK